MTQEKGTTLGKGGVVQRPTLTVKVVIKVKCILQKDNYAFSKCIVGMLWECINSQFHCIFQFELHINKIYFLR